MDCFFEAVASVWMCTRAKFMPSLSMNEVASAEESLYMCKNNLSQKIKEFEDIVSVLDKEIIKAKKMNDIPTVRLKLHERKRYCCRIEKTKNGLCMVEKQIDTLQSTELDKVLLNTLKASNNVLKKSGMKVKANEVENVMNELEERIQESSEVNQILGTPIQMNDMFSITEEDENELEPELLQELQQIEAMAADSTMIHSTTSIDPLSITTNDNPSNIITSSATTTQKEKEKGKTPLLDLA